MNAGRTEFTRPQLIDIIDTILPIFKGKIIDMNGNPARYINMDNFDYIKEITGEGVLFFITINLGTEQGKYDQKIIIKQFNALHHLENDVERYTIIESHLASSMDININQIIHIDRKLIFTTYEVKEGYTIDQLSIPNEGKNFLLGKIIAKIHGPMILANDENMIREYILFLLMNMPFTDEEREGFAVLLENHFSAFSKSFGSYRLSISPQVSNFSLHPTGEELTVGNIKQGKALQIYLGPEKSENLMNDRMFDIAAIYADYAYEEYRSNTNVNSTIVKILPIIKAYVEIYSQEQSTNIKQLYPDGLTLDLHFLAHAWLNEATKVQTTSVDSNIFEDRHILLYSHYILTKYPFKDILNKL